MSAIAPCVSEVWSKLDNTSWCGYGPVPDLLSPFVGSVRVCSFPPALPAYLPESFEASTLAPLRWSAFSAVRCQGKISCRNILGTFGDRSFRTSWSEEAGQDVTKVLLDAPSHGFYRHVDDISWENRVPLSSVVKVGGGWDRDVPGSSPGSAKVVSRPHYRVVPSSSIQ